MEAARMPNTVEIRKLDPHDPLPEGRAGRVIVLRRFDEDDPRKIVTEITLTGLPGRSEVVQPVRADGTAMSLDEAVFRRPKGREVRGNRSSIRAGSHGWAAGA